MALEHTYGVCGQLYSRFGVEVMIANVLACPDLQHIVVTGHEDTRFQSNGDRLVAQDVESNVLSSDVMREFYERVMIHDMRHVSVRDVMSLRPYLASLPNEPHGRDAIEVSLPTATMETFPAPRSGFLIRADSIRDAYWHILSQIRRFGEKTSPDKEGHYRQELWQMTVCLSPSTTPEAIHTSTEEMKSYGNSLWHGDEPETVTYRYGHTMRFRYGDQITEAMTILKRKHESFRPVITLWQPLESMIRDDEPCLITVHPRLRSGVLDMFAYIRTNDMYMGWPMNAAGLRIFQERMAAELDALPGELTITSGSAHIYDYALSFADEYLANHTPRRRITPDPMGDWNITKTDDGHIVAYHTHQGGFVQQRTTRTVAEMQDAIAPFLSDVSHALWIGQQLERLTKKETQ